MKNNSISTGDSGQSILEFVGTFPFVLFFLLVAFEAYTTITTVERIENATRTCARIASQTADPGEGEREGRAAMPDWVNSYDLGTEIPRPGGVACQVTAQVPLLWKNIPWDVTVVRRVDMPIG